MEMTAPLRVFIGYDRREHRQYEVTVESLRDHASVPVHVVRLQLDRLMKAGLYLRAFRLDDGQLYDMRDASTFSTEFSYSRYLVPALSLFDGLSIFCDSDFLWRADVAELAALYDARYAVQVVKHDHTPTETSKLRGIVQERYHRKNWTSLVLWNCGHRGNAILTPFQVNRAHRHWLHGLRWLDDDEIGALPEAWNWLDGHSPTSMEPRAVHFTRGTPDMLGPGGAAYDVEWWAYANAADGGASAA